MDKVIQLKEQLIEAVKLATSKKAGHKRLAVILLDNFVEIQLVDNIQMKFEYDGIFDREKKFIHQKRKKILRYYDELLAACVKESLITTEEQKLLSFCHQIRNNLYHKGNDEVLLIDLALSILREIIIKNQPSWKTARYITAITSDLDSYANPSEKNKSFLFKEINSEKDWNYFLAKHFKFGNKRKGAKLLAQHLNIMLSEIGSCMRFFKKDHHIYFPHTKGSTYNEFILNYSFPVIYADEIELIRETKDRKVAQQKMDELFNTHIQNWKPQNKERLKDFKRFSKTMEKLPIEQALEKFISIRDEVNLIYESLRYGAMKLDGEIQHQMDLARGK